MDYHGLVKRLQVPDGYIAPRELSYHDIRAHAISRADLSASGTPRRPAMASRWITAFVDPPIAALTRIAFSNAALVMMAEGRRSSRTRPTITWPARCAVS